MNWDGYSSIICCISSQTGSHAPRTMDDIFTEVRKILPEEFVTGRAGSLQEFVNELKADYSLDVNSEPPEDFKNYLWLILTAEYDSGKYVFTLPGDTAKWSAASPGDPYSNWLPYSEEIPERPKTDYLRPAPSRPTKELAYVFHGASEDHADSIIKEGFRPGMTANGKRYGNGFYFTEVERSARSWSADAMGNKGRGPVIRARISGAIAVVDQPKVDKTVRNGDFSSFPFLESDEDEARLRQLIMDNYSGAGVSESAIGVFLKEKGYSAMYLSPWREVVVFDSQSIIDMQKI